VSKSCAVRGSFFCGLYACALQTRGLEGRRLRKCHIGPQNRGNGFHASDACPKRSRKPKVTFSIRPEKNSQDERFSCHPSRSTLNRAATRCDRHIDTFTTVLDSHAEIQVIDLGFLSEIQKLASCAEVASANCIAREIFLKRSAMKRRCGTDTIVSFLTHWRHAAGHYQRKKFASASGLDGKCHKRILSAGVQVTVSES
jgi:hypothetical protein